MQILAKHCIIKYKEINSAALCVLHLRRRSITLTPGIRLLVYYRDCVLGFMCLGC
jgi:hypothetical protein